jgi:hemolysin activation/secretion protein
MTQFKLLFCLLPLLIWGEETFIKRIIFSSHAEDIHLKDSDFSHTHCIAIRNVPFLRSHTDFLKAFGRKFIGQPLTMARLQALEKEVANFYQIYESPLVRIAIPEQEVVDGTLFILVQEPQLGEWKIEGNCYFSTEKIKKELRIQPNCPVDLTILASDLAWLNDNPFRSVNAVLSPGSIAGKTDVDLIVNDRWPYRFYNGADNTGTTTTGLYRLFAGVNMGNLFGIGQRLSYQFTISTRFNRFLSHSAEYIAPLPWRHLLKFIGGYSQVKPDLHTPHLRQTGESWQVDLRYEIPFLKAKNGLLQRFTFGADFKETNNNLEFGGERILLHDIDIVQATVIYILGAEKQPYKTSLQLEFYGSPGHITSNNTNRAFERLRPFANCQYVYFRGEWSSAYFKKGWALTTDFWGQGASTNLLPSEQFDLGGYNTIRGYQQNEATTDNGLAASIEIHTPTMHFFKTSRFQDSLYFLGFIDYGWGKNHHLTVGEKSSINMAGVGPGLRYTMGPYLSARFDCAFPLIKAPYSPRSTQHVYFGLVASY